MLSMLAFEKKSRSIPISFQRPAAVFSGVTVRIWLAKRGRASLSSTMAPWPSHPSSAPGHLERRSAFAKLRTHAMQGTFSKELGSRCKTIERQSGLQKPW